MSWTIKASPQLDLLSPLEQAKEGDKVRIKPSEYAAVDDFNGPDSREDWKGTVSCIHKNTREDWKGMATVEWDRSISGRGHVPSGGDYKLEWLEVI